MMTPIQFEALARLMRLRSNDPSKQAAFLQMVKEMRPIEAALQVGISPNAATKAATRVRRGLELAKKAAGD
jgi:hypothetical protein